MMYDRNYAQDAGTAAAFGGMATEVHVYPATTLGPQQNPNQWGVCRGRNLRHHSAHGSPRKLTLLWALPVGGSTRRGGLAAGQAKSAAGLDTHAEGLVLCSEPT